MLRPLTNPYAMINAVVSIGLGHGAETFDDYTEHVSQAELTPTTTSGTWVGVGGNTLTFGSPSAWALNLGHVQDNAPDGLSDFLFDHDGEKATVRIVPEAGGRGWDVDVILAPGAIGGTGGPNAAVAAVTMGVQGKPRKVAAPDPAP